MNLKKVIQQKFSIKFITYLLNFIPIKNINIHKKALILVSSSNKIEHLLTILKKHINCQFHLLSAISGIDYLQRVQRFVIVYEILSLTFNIRVRVKVFLNENNSYNSIKHIFIAATWWEREIWDLFGIFFLKNKEIKRILTDYGFEGHPLRKDFPLSGYVETRYDENLKRVVCEPIEHLQEFRVFDFTTGWALKYGKIS